MAAFGAFVDVGVHQDGLVHVSALANRFVSDPRDVVKSGQVVRVKVLEADPERKRISLTLRLDDEPATARPAPARPASGGKPAQSNQPAQSGRPVQGAKPSQGGKPPEGGKTAQATKPGQSGRPAQSGKPSRSTTPAPVNTAMAEALRKAGLGK
ncbi:S1 RNA-binding domain-containing protein [Arthrobacter sp. SA17]